MINQRKIQPLALSMSLDPSLSLEKKRPAFQRFFRLSLLSILVLVLVGCSSSELLVKLPSNSDNATIDDYKLDQYKQDISLFNPLSLENKIKRQKLQQKTANLAVLIDTGNGMRQKYRDTNRQDYAFEIVERFNQSLPSLKLDGNIFKTWHPYFLWHHHLDASEAQILAALESPYDKQQWQDLASPGAGLLTVGEGKLSDGIMEIASQSLKTNQPWSLLIVTHWDRIDIDAIRTVRAIRQSSQQPVCIYTIGVGNSYSITRFDEVDQCGYSIAADKVAQPEDMAFFVERLFFSGPSDTDNDGIYDYMDKCPNSQPGRLMRFDGCYRFAGDKQ